MRDPIIEDILEETFKEQLRHRAQRNPVVPTASRYPHTAMRSELERHRQPWSQQDKAPQETSASQPFYL